MVIESIQMLTALQLSEKILKETIYPMNPEEIWNYAISKDYVKECNLNGKTPDHTIGAQIYTDIAKNQDSPFFKYSVKPQKFGLTAYRELYSDSTNTNSHSTKPRRSPFTERDLHPLLVAFIRSNGYFHAYGKTIFHEKSSKYGKNAEKWLHPDIVGVHYAFDDLDKKIVDLATKVGESVVRFYSFELKKEITSDTVREYYFQAVSNSSWANEGYLVSPMITDEAMQQLGKLNASFGIGVIKLNLNDIYQSEIVIPSRDNEALDLGMMDDLVRINPDFNELINNIHKTLKTDEPIAGHYDEVMDSNEIQDYIKKKHMDSSS